MAISAENWVNGWRSLRGETSHSKLLNILNIPGGQCVPRKPAEHLAVIDFNQPRFENCLYKTKNKPKNECSDTPCPRASGPSVSQTN